MEVKQTLILEHFLLVCALYYVQLFTAFQNLCMYTNLTGYSMVDQVQIFVFSPHQETPLHRAAGGALAAFEVTLRFGDVSIKDDNA